MLILSSHRRHGIRQGILLPCLNGNLHRVKSDLEQLENQQQLPIPLQPLATVVASKGHADILQLCLDKGAVVDVDLDRALQNGLDGPGTLDVLYVANWRDLQHSRSAVNTLVSDSVKRDVRVLTWLLAYGARVSRETVKHAARFKTPHA